MPVRPPPPPGPVKHGIHPLVLVAMEELGGPALVLDAALHVVAATPGAADLLGSPIPLGVSAPRLLCPRVAQPASRGARQVARNPEQIIEYGRHAMDS